MPKTEAEWTEAIHASLRQAVKKRIEIADVKVGVLLSGGLDSSLLVALLAEQGVPDLMTFSVGFEDQPEERGNEFEYSDPVAAMYGTRHHKYLIPNSRGAAPPARGGGADVRTDVRAGRGGVLSARRTGQQDGQGGAERAGRGRGVRRLFLVSEAWRRKPPARPLERFRRHYFDRDHDEFLEMVMPAYHGPDYTAEIIAAHLAEPFADDFIDQVLRMDTTMLITDDPVKRVDNMTMAWGLEARVPFLDHQLVELAARMPAELKLASDGKHVLKTIARGLVPDAVIDRKKGYFPMPALKYVRGEFFDFMRDILNSQACRERGLYHRAYVNKLLAAPEQHHTRIQGSKLWHLALLEFWLQKNA